MMSKVLDAYFGLSLAVYFGRTGPAKGDTSSRRPVSPANPSTARATITAFPERSGPRAAFSGVVSYVKGSNRRDTETTTTQLIIVRPRSTTGETRNIPTCMDDSG